MMIIWRNEKMKVTKKNAVSSFLTAAFAAILMLGFSAAQAETMLKPFINSTNAPGDLNATLGKTKSALTSGGFEIIGEYSPWKDAHVVVVTNDMLKKNAAKSEMGGFGAMQRISVAKVGGNIQVSYTNPVYMANVYRLSDDLSSVRAQLKKALGGADKEFGSEKGMTAEYLREYEYAGMEFVMPEFDKVYELGDYDSYEEAIKAVEDGFAEKRGGGIKVYRIDVPGKKETVYGVGLAGNSEDLECSGDDYIQQRVDGEELRGIAHFPYDLMVKDNEVISLHVKFRIAQSWPDLSMVAGDYTFFKIMCAPPTIEDAFLALIGED
jgi:hypothetical protein